MRDTLDTSAIVGSTINFHTGKVLQGATLLVDIGQMTELENVTGSTGDDTVFVAEAMTNNNAVVAPAGNNNGFAFFRGAVNTLLVANQGLYDINFGAGTADAVNFANESDQDIMVVLDMTAAGVDRVVVADAAGIDGALNTLNARVDILRGADVYYAGGADLRASGIDLSQHTGDLLTIQFSNNATALNAAGGTGEDIRQIQIVDGTTSIVKQFVDNGLTTQDRADIAAVGSTVTADLRGNFWNRIEGNNKNETINLTDRFRIVGRLINNSSPIFQHAMFWSDSWII